MTRLPRLAAVVALTLLALTVAAGGCGGDEDAAPPSTTEPGREAILSALAERIEASYATATASVETLGADLDTLCADPSDAALTDARTAWSTAVEDWRRTRAHAFGPDAEARLMADVGFGARPEEVESLLAGDEPVTPEGLDGRGSGVRGLHAVEVALFGPGSEALTTPQGARRCTFAASATALASDALTAVEAEWTDGYGAELAAGLDGDRDMSTSELLNAVTAAVTAVDEKGVRDLAALTPGDEVPEGRADGPSATSMAQLQAQLLGAADLIGDAEGQGLSALVAERSPATAARLDEATAAAEADLGLLPPSVAASVDQPDDLDAAAESVAALKVLLATEVASQLGVTIGFSDADGDS